MTASEPGPLGIGLVGAGAFGRFLVSATLTARWRTGARLVAVADADPAVADRLARQEGVRAYPDLAGLLSDEGVDAVLVATPPLAHAGDVGQAVAAGRPVLCEKPLAISADAAQSLAAAAAAADVVVAVDHVLRFSPLVDLVERLRDLLVDGERPYGRVHRVCYENDASDENLGPDHWFWDPRISGGIHVEHGVHVIDLTSALIGSEPTAVLGLFTSRLDGRVDTVAATASYPGGATASWYHSFTHAIPAERQLLRIDLGFAEARLHGWIPLTLEVDCLTDSAGATAVEAALSAPLVGWTGPPVQIQATSAMLGADGGVRRGRDQSRRVDRRLRLVATHVGTKAECYAGCVRSCVQDFLAAVRSGRPPLVDAAAAARAVRTAERASAANAAAGV